MLFPEWLALMKRTNKKQDVQTAIRKLGTHVGFARSSIKDAYKAIQKYRICQVTQLGDVWTALLQSNSQWKSFRHGHDYNGNLKRDK